MFTHRQVLLSLAILVIVSASKPPITLDVSDYLSNCVNEGTSLEEVRTRSIYHPLPSSHPNPCPLRLRVRVCIQALPQPLALAHTTPHAMRSRAPEHDALC